MNDVHDFCVIRRLTVAGVEKFHRLKSFPSFGQRSNTACDGVQLRQLFESVIGVLQRENNPTEQTRSSGIKSRTSA
jgi:hypothetical protein